MGGGGGMRRSEPFLRIIICKFGKVLMWKVSSDSELGGGVEWNGGRSIIQIGQMKGLTFYEYNEVSDPATFLLHPVNSNRI